jgi:NAD(P)-dependent dehydrogenase (short-subunit alcohol dehydrogenase family)
MEGAMGELDGKVAIVTAAGRRRSIGNSTALALARLGADVVVTGTGRDPATFPEDEKAVGWRDVESTADQIRELGRRALTATLDVTDAAQIDDMVSRTLAELGRIDILINNAALPIGADRIPMVEVDPGLFERVIAVKVMGSFLCSRAVAKVLIEQAEGGKVVNIASVAGKRGNADAMAYCAANFAMVGMTQSMARELGPHGVNVNCVCPGAVDTHRMDDIGRGTRWVEMAENTPIGRNGTDDETGEFCVYLCTEAASWIHGQSININGGSVMEH